MESAINNRNATRILLALSDVIVPHIYSPKLRERFPNIDLLISCGDLPYYYLEYIVSTVDVPLVYVRGNHDKVVEYSKNFRRSGPWGGIDLHRKIVREKELLIAGIEGSLRYRDGPFQYSQDEMWLHVISLIPRLVFNRLRYGRYLDIFVTHSPPAGIHDKSDLPHRGIKAFRWFIQAFKPQLHIHGHTHIYRPDEIKESRLGDTLVINAYGYCEKIIDVLNVDKRK